MRCCFGDRKPKTQISKSQKPSQDVNRKKGLVPDQLNQENPTKVNNKSNLNQVTEGRTESGQNELFGKKDDSNPNSNRQKGNQDHSRKDEIKSPRNQSKGQKIVMNSQKKESTFTNILSSFAPSKQSVIQYPKEEDYAIENNEANVMDLKAPTKNLKLLFFDQKSIIQTPAISFVRYDCLLLHHFTQPEESEGASPSVSPSKLDQSRLEQSRKTT